APALAERCGLAGLAPDFRAAGLRAGLAARDALSGVPLDEDSYPTADLGPGPEIAASTKTPSGR
ncbi:MAG TPA: hypothetical protein VH309_08240, partial [Elusimicrobiota bacterium]|nr:hypothetical protein [Elusimicrobiota bacterium]